MSYATEVLADVPGFWYRTQEASGLPQDSSGNANHCTASTGSATYRVPGPGTIGGFGIGFSGTQMFTAPDSASMSFLDVYTLEFWIKRSITGAGSYAAISKGGPGGAQPASYYLRIAADALNLLRSGTANMVSSTTTITDTTTWHHCVATKNGATQHLYIDKVDVTGAVTNSTNVDNTQPLTIGADDASVVNDPQNGVLSEIAGYPTELSAARVAAHYDAAFASLVVIGLRSDLNRPFGPF